MNFRLFFLAIVCAASLASSAHAVSVSSSTHPSLVSYDFASASAAVPFVPYQKEGGVASGARFKTENGALVISNSHAGSFGVNTKIAAFDAEKFGRLVFDYALQPDVKVNFFFRLNGVYHGVIFSGPGEVRAGGVLLGSIPNVVADGKWHRAEIPLREWLRNLYPTNGQLMVDEIIIGNWDNSNYLMAGIGGNGPGAQWKIDNFAITGVGPAQAKFSVLNGENMPVRAGEYSWSLDDEASAALPAGELSLSAREGFHLLKILDKARKPVATYGFVVAEEGPKVGKPEIRDNTIRVPITSSAGLDWTGLKLGVGGREFQLDSPFLVWDGTNGVLALKAAAAGLEWKDDQEITVALEGVRDVLGRATISPKSSLKIDYGAHKSAPPLPEVVQLKSMGDGSFETTLDEWTPKPSAEGAAIIERDRDTRSHGDYSVRLTSPSNAATFAASIRRTSFDAAKYPVVEFDYKIPPELRVDFVINWAGQMYSIGFTDRTPQYSRLGQIQNVVADNQWHHARLPLFDMMRAARPAAGDFTINALTLEDHGWLGNAKGTVYWIDDFQFVPVVIGERFESKVLAPDVTSIKGVSFVLDETPTTDPPLQAKATDTVSISGSGSKWLHVRVQNGAGIWSPSTHVPLMMDNSPPRVQDPTPARGSKAAADALQIPLSDDTAIDVSSVALTVQGREYSLKEATILRFENSKLSFDLDSAVAQGRLKPLGDGEKITWQLKPVRDVAGHVVSETSGDWSHDFASDKEGPETTLSSNSHLVQVRNDFDEEENANPAPVIEPRPGNNRGNRRRVFGRTGQTWQGFWSAENLLIERGKRGAEEEGNQTLRAVTPAANAPFSLRLMRGWDVKQFPVFGFAYKAPANANLYVRVRVANGQLFSIKFLGAATGSLIGEIPGAVADDKWHWAAFDLGAVQEKLGNNQIQMLEIVDASGKMPQGWAFEIDDFAAQKKPAGNVKLNWKATDISGVQNYRIAWDQAPDTKPTEVTTKTSDEFKPATGIWWFHAQAQDSAGNWGAVTHLPIYLP